MVCVELDIEDGELGSAVRERMEHAGHVVGGDSPATIITDSALRAVLHRFRGNQTRAAKTLGIGRNTLWRKLRRHEDPKSPQP